MSPSAIWWETTPIPTPNSSRSSSPSFCSSSTYIPPVVPPIVRNVRFALPPPSSYERPRIHHVYDAMGIECPKTSFAQRFVRFQKCGIPSQKYVCSDETPAYDVNGIEVLPESLSTRLVRFAELPKVDKHNDEQ